MATRTAASSPFNAGAQLLGISTGLGTVKDIQPWVTQDGNTLYFASDRADSKFHVYRATRATASDPFGSITDVINTAASDSAPVLTADQLTIFFSSDRTGSVGDAAIWTATRSTAGDGFGAATRLAELDGTSSIDHPSWVSPEGCTLYFVSNGQTSRAGGRDLYRASEIANAFWIRSWSSAIAPEAIM